MNNDPSPNGQSEKEDTGKKDITILVEISPDKTEAFITAIPLSDTPKLNRDEIIKALSERGIKFGIREELFEELEKEPKFNEKILLAVGQKPKEEKGLSIEYEFPINETVRIKKGEKIGEIIEPEDGIEGITVFGQKLLPKEPKKTQLPKMTNAAFSADNESIIISTREGYLTIDQTSITVTPFFDLEISEDKTKAYITVAQPLENVEFSGEDLVRFLKEKEITCGIRENEIEEIFQFSKFGKKILIAEGTPVVHGIDGEVKYYFETQIKPKMDEKGNLDYKSLTLIQNVRKEQKLAELIPPVPGSEGCTVFGEKIRPKEGVSAVLPTGKNVTIYPENQNLLIAEIDGHVKLKGKKIDVEPVFIVKDDVDFSTGNIEFIGSVIVKGDVQSGFTIKADADVEVSGVVEDAIIEAGGDVLLKGGFIGKGEGRITAKGKVIAQFCDDQTIISEGNVEINDYIMNSHIETKNMVIVTEQTGLIVGGEIFALRGIEAKTIGNDNYVPTELYVGIDKETIEQIKELKEQLQDTIIKGEEIEKAYNMLLEQKTHQKVLSEEKKNLFDKTIAMKEKIDEQKKRIVSEIEELENKQREYKNSVVKITDVVFPGTSITIFNRSTEVNEALKFVCYQYGKDEIVSVDLDESKQPAPTSGTENSQDTSKSNYNTPEQTSNPKENE